MTKEIKEKIVNANTINDNSEYGAEKKEILFRDTTKRHAELKLQLQYEGLKMAPFLRECVTFFLNKDPLMLELIDKMKGIDKPHSTKAKELKIVKNEREKTKEIKKQFQLDQNEIENIFDILEEEHPDL